MTQKLGSMQIRPLVGEDIDAVVDLSLRAWAPVFVSIEEACGSEIFRALHPDWRADQARAVTSACESKSAHVWVADVDGVGAVGFVAVQLSEVQSLGEIYMVAVHPDYQRRGYGDALTQFALKWIREAGKEVAMVGTGGDPGHGPARRIYEKAGFTLVPMVRYFKKL